MVGIEMGFLFFVVFSIVWFLYWAYLIKTIKLLKEISHTIMMALDSASAVHLLEVMLQRCAMED